MLHCADGQIERLTYWLYIWAPFRGIPTSRPSSPKRWNFQTFKAIKACWCPSCSYYLLPPSCNADHGLYGSTSCCI